MCHDIRAIFRICITWFDFRQSFFKVRLQALALDFRYARMYHLLITWEDTGRCKARIWPTKVAGMEAGYLSRLRWYSLFDYWDLVGLQTQFRHWRKSACVHTFCGFSLLRSKYSNFWSLILWHIPFKVTQTPKGLGARILNQWYFRSVDKIWSKWQ